MKDGRALYTDFLRGVLPYPPHWYDLKTEKELCAIYHAQKKKLEKRNASYFEADDSKIRAVLSHVVEPIRGPEDMPKTPDGKIDFIKLRERYPANPTLGGSL